jgi:hypothetical protein
MIESSAAPGEEELRYQDLKLRDAGRLGLMAIGCAVALVLGLWFRPAVEPVIAKLHPAYDGRAAYLGCMSALLLVAIVCTCMAVYYLLSSPAQNAKFIERMVSLGSKLPKKFDPSLLDPAEPDYGVTTLTYLRRKWSARRAD